MIDGAKKILIVDDDSDFLESLYLILIRENHDVVSATNGHDALTRYREFRPDIVFLDVKMPGISGYEAFLRIRKYDSGAKVVLLSNYALDDLKYEEAKKQCLAGLINKPIDLAVLKKMIKRHAKQP